MGAYGSKLFKMLRFPQIAFDFFFKLLVNFLLSGPNNSSVLHFLNFEFTIFQDFCFCFVFVNMGPYGK